METLVEDILSTNFDSLQELIDFISSQGDACGYPDSSFGLYSSEFHNPDKLSLICAVGEEILPVRVNRSSQKYNPYPVDLSFNRNGLLYICTMSNGVSVKLSPLLVASISTKINLLLFKKRQAARNYLVSTANEKADINSFVVKILNKLKKTLVYSDSISIYIYHEVFQRVRLSASSEELGKKKEEYIYSYSWNNPVVDCIKRGMPYLYYKDAGILESWGDEKDIFFFDPKKTKSLLLWPIRFTSADSNTGEVGTYPIGAIQIHDIHRKCGEVKWFTRFTNYDALILAFISEIIYMVISAALRVEVKQKNYRVFAHGMVSSVDYIGAQISDVRDFLYNVSTSTDSFEKEGVEALFEIKEGALNKKQKKQISVAKDFEDYIFNPERYKSDANQIYQLLTDTQTSLDDIAFHFDKVLGIRSDFGKRYIKILPDVFMPLFRQNVNIARFHKKNPPKFNNFILGGLRDVRSIKSNEKILLSVFRNLTENSIKYSKPTGAEISIRAQEISNHIVITFEDSGIGIEENEVELVFHEGYRGHRASILDNQGVGWGLGFCRDALELVNGTIVCQYKPNGARFRVKLPFYN